MFLEWVLHRILKCLAIIIDMFVLFPKLSIIENLLSWFLYQGFSYYFINQCIVNLRLGGKQMEDGSYQTPIISLNYNFPPPTHEVPSLLSQGMVENLFHEMGHAMHSMLGRAR